MVGPDFITTGLDFPGYKIDRNVGIARGITVRSRNVCSTIAGLFCSCAGGRVEIFVHLCETAREEALQLLIRQAEHMGGNAIVGFRYEAHDVVNGVTEVLAYGTVVVVSKVSKE